MTQTWQDLLFAHWPVKVSQLRALVPAVLPLDTFDGQAYLGVVPFRMSGVRPRLMPLLPWISAFAELNVRTYVTIENKPGVYFFSLDAANPLAVEVARRWYWLQYFHARMSVRQEGGHIHYTNCRTDRRSPAAAEFHAKYRPTAAVFHAEQGTLAHWLTERYCLYTVDARGRVVRAEIHHARWPLQPAEATLRTNTMTMPLGLRLPDSPPILYFAGRLDVVVWPPRRVAWPQA